MSTEVTLDEIKRFIVSEDCSEEIIKEDLKSIIDNLAKSEVGKEIIDKARKGALERLGKEAESGGNDIVSGAVQTIRKLLGSNNPKKK